MFLITPMRITSCSALHLTTSLRTRTVISESTEGLIFPVHHSLVKAVDHDYNKRRERQLDWEMITVSLHCTSQGFESCTFLIALLPFTAQKTSPSWKITRFCERPKVKRWSMSQCGACGRRDATCQVRGCVWIIPSSFIVLSTGWASYHWIPLYIAGDAAECISKLRA